MNIKLLTLMLITLTLASASLAAFTPIFPRAHAAGTSLVCLADPGFMTTPGANACPATTSTFTGPNAPPSGAQLRVDINVNNTMALNGFDITVLADHTKLQPFGVDLSSSVVAGLQVSNECIGGIAVQGSCPSQAANNLDTIEVGAGSSAFTNNPAFGTLFTAIYTIVGNTTKTSLSFQTGCGSLTSLPPLCIILTSGGAVNDPVNTVRLADYVTGSSPQPIIALNPRPLVLNLTQGVAGQASSEVTMNELNGFSCGGVNCVTLSIVKSFTIGPNISMNVTQLADPPSSAVKISVSTSSFTPSGIFTFYVQAEPLIGGNAPSTGSTYLGTLANITVTIVGANDFAISAVPNKVIASVGNPGTSTIEIAWGKTLTGSIGFRAGYPTSLTCMINPQSLTFSTSLPLQRAMLSCVSSATGTYIVSIEASQLSLTHTAVLSYIAVGPPPSPPSVVGIWPGNQSSTSPNLAPGNQVKFSVNLTNAPPIHAYTIQFEYNPKVLSVAPNGIDPTGGLLGSAMTTLVECVDGNIIIGSTCTTLDDPGVITLSESIVGSGNSTSSSGVLFTVAFSILQRGVSQIHLLNAVVVGGAPLGFSGSLVNVTLADSYFSDMTCGSRLCQPPVISFTTTPAPPILAFSAIQFDASASSSPNQGAGISAYTWFWNEAGSNSPNFDTTKLPIIQHTFVLENRPHFITLSANDTDGVVGYATVKAQVVANPSTFDLVGCPPLNIPSGSRATCDIAVISHASTSIDVSLSVSGTPDSVLASITPAVSVAPSSTVTAILSVSNLGNLSGTFILTISGSFSSTSHSIGVSIDLIPPVLPPDFLLNIFPTNLTIPAGSSGVSGLYATGLRGFAGTVTLTWNVSPSPSNAPTASFIPPVLVIDPNQPYPANSIVTVSTLLATPPGNYVLTVIGTGGQLSHLVKIFIRVAPPPSITVSPTTGPTGTKVVVNGSGFQPSQFFTYPVEVFVTFDDMLAGFTYATNGRFNFTLDVPQAQPGVHQIKATANFFFGPGIQTLAAQATFLVQASPAAPTVSMDSGTVYFPGDTAVIYVLSTVNGSLITPANSQLDITLTLPNGTSIVLHPAQVSSGVYKSSYQIPTTGSLGVYAMVASLHVSGSIDAFALRSFEVKLSWLSSNGRTIGAAVTIAGVLGLVGLGWKKGVFKKKNGQIALF